MGARQFSATLLLALLWPNAPGQPLRLQQFTPLTLKPVGAQVKLDYSWFYGYQNFAVENGSVLVRLPNEVEVIDGRSLEVTQRDPFRHKGACAVAFDGTTVVVITSCLTSDSKSFTVWRLTPSSRRSVAVSKLDPLTYPVSFAFGDGDWFIARGDGTVDVVDLRTGHVTTHRPRRSLAKGRGFVNASWLGEHRLGLNGTVVDVRTWRKRSLAPGAERLDAIGGYIVAHGKKGITVFDHSLRLYRRLAAGRVIDRVWLSGGIVYAQIGLAWDEWNLRTGKHLGIVLPDTPWLLQLLR